MSKLLVTYSGNWADEMDLDGFCLIDADEWKAKKKRLRAWFAPKEKADKEAAEQAKASGSYYYSRDEHLTISVGTNEEVHYGSYDSWLGDFKERKLTEEEAATIKKLFGLTKDRNEYGFFLYPDMDYLEEENESEEDEEEYDD
jgi:hypothetical protein